MFEPFLSIDDLGTLQHGSLIAVHYKAPAPKVMKFAERLKDELKRINRPDVLILLLDPDTTVTKLNEAQMEQFGWVRKQQ